MNDSQLALELFGELRRAVAGEAVLITLSNAAESDDYVVSIAGELPQPVFSLVLAIVEEFHVDLNSSPDAGLVLS